MARSLARRLVLVGSLCAASALPAMAPKPEVLITTLRTVGHRLPRDLLVQLYANAIKLSDLSGAANGTILSGPNVDRGSATSNAPSRSAVSLAAETEVKDTSRGPNRVWLCKRPVYPVSLLTQFGIPIDVAEEVNARGYHAYVLHGPRPDDSLAYQFTSTNGWELWNKVLGILKDHGAGGMESLSKEDVAEWGKTVAAEIMGPAETSSSPGVKVFTSASQCWGSELPSQCSQAQMEEATTAYAARRPEFNLLSNNCARFACSMLALCGGTRPSEAALSLLANSSDAAPASPTCQPEVCADHLMFEGPKGEPGCGMHSVSTNLADYLAGATRLSAAPASAALPEDAAQPASQQQEQPTARPAAQQGGSSALIADMSFM